MATITDVVNTLSDQLDDVYSGLLRLVLYGLKVPRHFVDEQKTFPLLFDVLDKKMASPGTASALIIHFLKRFGYNNSTGLEPFANQFEIRDYQEVDLRLTVAGFFFNFKKDDLSNMFLKISSDYLNNLSRDKMKSVTEVVEILCFRRIVTTNDISPMQDIARCRHLPGYFNEYCQKYNLPTDGITIEAASIPKLLHNADEVIYPLKRISFNETDEIKHGSFGTIVYKGKFEETEDIEGREVAVKKIHRNVYSVSERKLLIKCDCHPNIIRYHCIEQDETCYYLALQLCLCSLSEYIENKVDYPGNIISHFQIINDVINGLEFLHKIKIIHRDIRPSNILLTDKPNPKAVISDFGISRILPDGREDITTSGRKGAGGWIAPEMYKKDTKLRLAIDIFSMGCLIYYVLTNGRHPFDEDEFNVTHSDYKLLLGDADEVVKLIEQMIDRDYTKRPDIIQIKEIWNELESFRIHDSPNEEKQLEELYLENGGPSNNEMSLEEEQEFIKELQHSLYTDLETSQQTIKSLQEALLDTKEELNKQVKEKDSLIAKLTRKVPEYTLVNELEEKDKVISELVRKLQKTEELRREKKQDEESKPTDRSIGDDDITFELEQKNTIITNLSNELRTLKGSNKLIDDDKSIRQLVHDNDCQFTLDDVSKLMVILQPVEDDWYQLGHHLDMEESTLRDIKQTDIPLEYLLQRWCSEGGTLMKLEKALIDLCRTDVISGLHDLKQTSNDNTSSNTDASVQCDYWNINDLFKGLLTVGKKNDFYRADIEHEMTLEECGLKLFIPEGVVTPPESVFEVAVQGLWGGDFIFPEGANLISGVCYISISSLSHLNKPVTVQLEHCANIIHQDQVKYLSFVKANSDRPPYHFNLLPGGIFNPHTQHGTIALHSFSLIAICKIANEDTSIILPNRRGVCMGLVVLAAGVLAVIIGAAVQGVPFLIGFGTVLVVVGISYIFKYSNAFESPSVPSLSDRFEVLVMYKAECNKAVISIIVIQSLVYLKEILKYQQYGVEIKRFQFNDSIELLTDNWIDGWEIKPLSTAIKMENVAESTAVNPSCITVELHPHPNEESFKRDIQYTFNLKGIDEPVTISISYDEVCITEAALAAITNNTT